MNAQKKPWTKPKLIKRSAEQSKIDAALVKRKKWLIENEPNCIFCNKYVGNSGQLAHKIRRSYASSYHSRYEIQTMDLNTGLAHHDCHDIFDNKPIEAKDLPNYKQVMDDIKNIDPEYHRRMINRF